MKKQVALSLIFALNFGHSNTVKAMDFGLPNTLQDPAILKAIAALAVAAGSYYYYRYAPINFDPTLENINATTMTPKNDGSLDLEKGISIPEDQETVFIFSHGYAGPIGSAPVKGAGKGVALASWFTKGNIINGPCVTFDYPENWPRCFTFGQGLEIDCLKKIYDEVASRGSVNNIIIVASSRGALVALNMLTNHPDNQFEKLKAVILEGPAISLKGASRQISDNFLTYLPGHRTILYNFFKMMFPNYNPAEDNLMDRVGNLPANLPMLIGYLDGDKVIPGDEVESFVKILEKKGKAVESICVPNYSGRNHAKLNRDLAFQQAANVFLQKHGLPHSQTVVGAQSLAEVVVS